MTSTQRPRPVTAYFRTTFEVEDPKTWERLELQHKIDDGGVIYLNGKELTRVNMPAGPLTADTVASRNISSAGWRFLREAIAAPASSYLVAGRNVLCAQVHQYRVGSKDMMFDLSLSAIVKGAIEEEIFGERAI